MAKSTNRLLRPTPKGEVTTTRNGRHTGELHCIVTEIHDREVTVHPYPTETIAVEDIDRHQAPLLWIDCSGLPQPHVIDHLETRFGLHPLTIEDLRNFRHRPKSELLDDYLFFILKRWIWDAGNQQTSFGHQAVVIGRNFVLTFQQYPGDAFCNIRDGLIRDPKQARARGADFLGYLCLDVIVDQYLLVISSVADALEELEEELLLEARPETEHQLHHLTMELLNLRRNVKPIYDYVQVLVKTENPFILERNRKFFRDLRDHVTHVFDGVVYYREMLAHLHDIVTAHQNRRLNEIMKILTVISTVFLPLNLIAGIYGMNFDHMPELAWGYPWILLLMATIGGTTLVVLKFKRWL